MKLIGPFKQLLPMTGLPLKGALKDHQLPLLENAGLVVDHGRILEVGNFHKLEKRASENKAEIISLTGNQVGLPGFIDSHTHICFAGSRAADYSLRNSGHSYLEIAKAGGGIWDTVTKTRNAGREELEDGVVRRARRHLSDGVTTIEVKSGYGLSPDEELKMLRAIRAASARAAATLVPTCLAAHMLPRDFGGTAPEYLSLLTGELLPVLKREGLCNRVDAFIEETAFSQDDINPYYTEAKQLGFDITVHADQFTVGGSEVAIAHGAISADHLEASTKSEIEKLARSQVIATALPGATLGLGCGFAPARRLLDAGAALAIASDWNPGSAPMGKLLAQAAILGAFEKLSNTEVLSGITYRAAAALNLQDRGRLQAGMLADIVAFPVADYREILYQQGSLAPSMVFKEGNRVNRDESN